MLVRDCGPTHANWRVIAKITDALGLLLVTMPTPYHSINWKCKTKAHAVDCDVGTSLKKTKSIPSEIRTRDFRITA
jgi:hypothetical protein